MQQQFSYFCLVVAVVIGGFFAGCGEPKCGEDINCVAMAPENSAPWPNEVKTGSVDQAIGETYAIFRDFGRARAWSLLMSGLMFAPLIIIFVIPGFITGRMEKIVEGVLWLVWSVLLRALAVYTRMDDMALWAVWAGIVPAIMLLIWGVMSDDDKGKLLLAGLPLLAGTFYTIWTVFSDLVIGFVYRPISMTVLLVAKFFFVLWLKKLQK